MKQLIDNDIVTLMTIALGFSKCTGAVVTIKYGDVILQYCEISVVLRLTSESEKFQIIWSEEHQGIWIIAHGAYDKPCIFGDCWHRRCWHGF